MALVKTPLSINFSKGLDTKTDPFQVQAGKFLALENSVFDKAGRLTKRNGFGPLTGLPDNTATLLTTFNGNLTAVGNKLEAFSSGSSTWLNQGNLQPVKLDTISLIKNNVNEIYADSVVADNGFVCTVYTDSTPTGLFHRYAITDVSTGQNIVKPTNITNADPTFGTPKVFILGNFFMIVYTRLITGTYHLEYIAITITTPTAVSAPTNITSQYIPTSTVAFDGKVANNSLYLAWNGSDVGGSIRSKYITSTLVQSNTIVYAGQKATIVSVTEDNTTTIPTIYVSYYDSVSNNGFILAYDATLGAILAPTAIITGEDVANITSTANNGIANVFYEVNNDYAFIAVPSNFINKLTVTQSGTVGPTTVLERSVGLASKAFLFNNVNYMLTAYSSGFQPTYFLITDQGQIVTKLAYANGGGYLTTGLPSVTIQGSTVYIDYLVTDLIQAGGKETSAGVNNPSPIYTQLGVNLAKFTIGNVVSTSAEIGQNLNLSGGFLWSYDGFQPTENGFFVWPEPITVTATTGGSMSLQQYFYQVVYEWSDNQGNIFRSAPSVPVTVTLSGGDNAVVVQGPCLRLTYKIDNPVKIVIYRWSVAQQIYYQVTSIQNPLLNNPNVDQFSFTDGKSDAQILGNNILYTTGGVIENIGPPATDLITLFNNRLWLVDSEDRNLLWFSKQVIENTPVDMSDLLTMFIAPTTASEGSTGPITALSPMDDKLIVYKQNALGYISGIGPDNTGANNGYSDFTLINSVVGCENQNSIVFTPAGLMFQSNKGIWLLGRDLSTQYIGAPVEDYTLTSLVVSALNIPSTNQVRFSLDSGVTLMYDYFFGEWSVFTKVPAVSSTIYKGLYTYVNSLGNVFQETPGLYLDNTSPVLMKFTTSWINLAGIQGFERFYQMYLLGTYLSPFKLNIQLAYNYNPSATQATTITPISPGAVYGGDPLYGSSELWGGPGNVFEARLFPQVQKCESFQVTVAEVYDHMLGQVPGAGLTLSGMNLVVGMKRGFRTQSASRSFG